MKNKPKSPQRIIETKPFIKKYNWEGIHYSSEKDDWKKFEKFNLTVALNFSILKQEKQQKQTIPLIIPNGKRWNNLVVKKVSTLFRGMTSKNHSVIYCLNYIYYFTTENKRESQKKYLKIMIFATW